MVNQLISIHQSKYIYMHNRADNDNKNDNADILKQASIFSLRGWEKGKRENYITSNVYAIHPIIYTPIHIYLYP